ncbi:MAG: hypothetical protein HYW65_00405 [Candidatus Liptonbacteria bacterium]|nr:hypothetical protein [Candidatus Liptonbacteria bacterium]
MNPTLNKIAAILGVLVLGVVAYYGTYLPFQKSRTFINTIRGMGGARSIEEFKKMFDAPLRIPSPIGQEELVRNMASEIVGLVGKGSTNPEIEEELLKFVAQHFEPFVASGKGMSFGQDLYILGTLHRIVYQHTKKAEYLDAAEGYFLRALELGPKRPQSLYTLLDIYLAKQDVARVKQIAGQINRQWPTDARVSEILKVVQQAEAASSSPAPAPALAPKAKK